MKEGGTLNAIYGIENQKLVMLRNTVKEVNNLPVSLDLRQARFQEQAAPNLRLSSLVAIYLMPIERLGLSAKTLEGIKELAIYDIGQLLSTDAKILFNHELIGKAGLREIFQSLEQQGIEIPFSIERDGKVIFTRSRQSPDLVWSNDSSNMTLAQFSKTYLSKLVPKNSLHTRSRYHLLTVRQKAALQFEIDGVKRERAAKALGITNRTLTNIILDARKVLGVTGEELKVLRNKSGDNPARLTHIVLRNLFSELNLDPNTTPASLGIKSWKKLLYECAVLIKTLPAERGRALKCRLRGYDLSTSAQELGLPKYKSIRLMRYASRDLRSRFKAILLCDSPTPQIPKERWAAFSTPEKRKVFSDYIGGQKTSDILKLNPWLKNRAALQQLTYTFRKEFNLSVKYVRKKRAVNAAVLTKANSKVVVGNVIKVVFPDGIPPSIENRMPRREMAKKALQLSRTLSQHRGTTLMFHLRVYGLSNNQIGLLLNRNKGTCSMNVKRLAKKIKGALIL